MPTRGAFVLTFFSVVFAGVFGGVIGYGLVDVGCTGNCSDARIFGTVIGALGGAVGVGVVAVLVLRAMAVRVTPERVLLARRWLGAWRECDSSEHFGERYARLATGFLRAAP
jgi:hypothetical protein